MCALGARKQQGSVTWTALIACMRTPPDVIILVVGGQYLPLVNLACIHATKVSTVSSQYSMQSILIY